VTTGSVDYAEQRTYTAANDQKWTLTSLTGNEYRIVNVANGKALDIEGASVSNGARAILAASTGSASQRWVAAATSGGYYTLAAVHSGKALDVSGGSLADGAIVLQYTNNSATNQQWAPQAP
jgi:glutamate synthase domain-containing protein 3